MATSKTTKKKPGKVGKASGDIFAPTVARPEIGLEVTPRQPKGRPAAPEAYEKVTVCLFDRHVLFLDKVALAIREKTRKHVKRAELVRSIVDHAAAWVRPDKPDADFDKAVRSLLPGLEGKDA